MTREEVKGKEGGRAGWGEEGEGEGGMKGWRKGWWDEVGRRYIIC